MFDVDLVQRLVEHFLVQEQTATEGESPTTTTTAASTGKQMGIVNAKSRVARLIDSYLTEVSRDRACRSPNFKFCQRPCRSPPGPAMTVSTAPSIPTSR
ncbi:hypothetical protein HPP92_005979 [Vanilla planifolia]|uniref:NPH3 domain-containing protein n=1 Tax=Vanilla planifolia TaxID=51239 RepID=A0A835RJH5_VANPL|nr:hypothetical protein HPP92_005972 [Vanilla planifolia]KAG0492581.1 hypothetical protein HPP92_005979 [Vanilla planifolia]